MYLGWGVVDEAVSVDFEQDFACKVGDLSDKVEYYF